MSSNRFVATACALALLVVQTACARPDPANPALWHVEGPKGQSAWLFGTIHALSRPAAWRTPRVEQALGKSDELLVEIADLNNDDATREIYDQLAHSPGQPPIENRVRPDLRASLMHLVDKAGLKPGSFADTETWAAALMLSHVAQGPDEDAANGVDRDLLKSTRLLVGELEGTRKQLGLFDTLPESAQRAMLESVVTDAPHALQETQQLARAWRQGDMGWIERQTQGGMLANPVLRNVLYVRRNLAWSEAIKQAMAQGRHPFVAVGAAHMAGAQGLPALLAAKGYRVTRVE
ncbi:MAG: TraB/GumN family protein [Sphingomonadales bacterium]|nr:TraB/GumN family protein [Sphingomonadales bacterium]MDE2170202.1 TraB/GumN family protein [Sphingomonadales bacterium]